MESHPRELVQQPQNEPVIPMHEVLAGEEVAQTATVAVDEMPMTGNPKSDLTRLWELCALTVAEKSYRRTVLEAPPGVESLRSQSGAR